MTDPSALRTSYERGALVEADLAPTPAAQFARWFDDALASGTPEPNAMTLATVSPSGQPSARIVLLKGFDEAGFVFYTHYTSRKGREAEATDGGVGRAALCFWWPPLERQVRVEGAVQRVSAAESDAYFALRPRGSQLGAQASQQSAVVPDRAALDAALAAAEERFDGQAVPRPDGWGGYRLVPEAVEFWQGRAGRMHDRLRFRRTEDADAGNRLVRNGWTVERLAP